MARQGGAGGEHGLDRRGDQGGSRQQLE